MQANQIIQFNQKENNQVQIKNRIANDFYKNYEPVKKLKSRWDAREEDFISTVN
jgi:hypothetical protein